MQNLVQNVAFLAFVTVVGLTLAATKKSECPSITKRDENQILPSVMMVILVRNKEHTLPWFLAGIERLKYPKRRISLWIRSDHNIDKSGPLLERWVSKVKTAYHSVDLKIEDEPKEYVGQNTSGQWTEERTEKMISLREEGLQEARRRWADYVFYIDADIVLYNQNTLRILIDRNKVVVAPMMNCTDAKFYSNFWGGMTDEGFYKRTYEYIEIVQREKMGVFQVPIVHSVFLIDLNHRLSTKISFHAHPDYRLPRDDLIMWAHSFAYYEIPTYIDNSELFGFSMTAAREDSTIWTERGWFSYLKMEAAVALEITELPVSNYIKPELVEKSKFGIDELYVINLPRRTLRRKRMENCLDEVGIDARFVDAVDGRQLNETYLINLGVKMMPDYIDRYHKRPLTMGEIGCFLSHYRLWEEMVEKKYERIIVFEDDVRFEAFFPFKLSVILSQAMKAVPDWDLIYLGRKIMYGRSEEFVEGADNLVRPYYTYWTISYMLSLSGAKKLLAQKPLEKMVPVDEYLPIMFDHHPLEKWKSHFSPRNLVALSAEPRLVHPTHYTGMANYVTDTEDTDVYTKFAESKVEEIYQSIAEGEQKYLNKVIDRAERLRIMECEAKGGCEEDLDEV